MIRRHFQLLRTLWDDVRTSFWFIPMLLAAAGVGLAAFGIRLDGSLDPGGRMGWALYVGSPADAGDRLGTLLASMITMASLVFSITIVVLTLAASQFGPRLIRTFMASLRTQITLGIYVMTIVFCLIAYASISGRDAAAEGYVTVTLAVALTLVSVALLVLHIHALSRSMVSETVIEAVGRELDKGIEELHPLETPIEEDPRAVLPDDFHARADFFGPSRSGYIEAIETDEIVEAARRADVMVAFFFRSGDFVAADGRGIGVYPAHLSSPDLRRAITKGVSVGPHRTPVQDLEFAIRHLVEIAVRALSPGINDPYTAVSVVNRLSASLARVMGRALPQSVRRDAADQVRLVSPQPTYESLISSAFNQIRQSGGTKPLVLITLLDAVARIAPHVRTETQRAALAADLERLRETARREINDPNDLSDVEVRVRHAEGAIRGERGGGRDG